MARPAPDALDDLLAAIPVLTGLPATATHRDRFQRYLQVFLKWNRVHRMTALESPADIIRGLFLDSLLFFRLLPARPLSLLDIGAGAGIPGLPLRLVDDRIALTLIEAKRKRVSFLLAACRELGLSDVHVLEGRAEDLIDRDPGLAKSFDVVVARAVGSEALMTLGGRYVRAGGTIAVAGSPRSPAGAGIDVVKVQVPGSRTSRVFLRRTKESSVPRGT
jgi:16S rRNA (guanine527-N7)-methyltransferase